MPAPIDFTIAIPTFRRPELLARAVASAVRQSFGRPFEILVVDSAAEGLDLRDLPCAGFDGPARVLHAKYPGASHARNLALREAQGSIVAFLDDDAEATPEWLQALAQVYDSDNGTIASAGGRIIPQFSQPPPQWLQEAYDLIAYEYSALDLGTAAHTLFYPQTLYGPNLSVRRNVALACGGFREDLGPRNGDWYPGEEVEFIDRLQHLGHFVCWVPSAVVRHNVPRDRMTRAFLRRRAYARGLSAGLHNVTGPRTWPSRNRHMVRMAASAAYHGALSQWLWLAGRTRAAVVHDRASARWAGLVRGRLQRRLRPRL